MFDLFDVTAQVQYDTENVHYNVTFEKSCVSGRIQNVKYFYNGEECDIEDLWDPADIQQFKLMLANYKIFNYTVKEI